MHKITEVKVLSRKELEKLKVKQKYCKSKVQHVTLSSSKCSYHSTQPIVVIKNKIKLKFMPKGKKS